MMTEVGGPDLPVRTCARRLAPIAGLDSDLHRPGGTVLHPDLGGEPPPPAIECAISWHGPARLDGYAGSEATIQARTGLMHLHGRDWGGPRRLGLEIASVAAGVLAASGVVAALIGRNRGRRVGKVETSVLQAGLLAASHQFAAATCFEEWVPAPPGPAPGPPFRSADGRWFEIETLDPEAWKAFWLRLGAGGAELGRAWTLFRSRYYRGTCTLPPGLHEATANRTLSELARIAAECRVSLCPVRGYAEVMASPGPGAGHPDVEPASAPAGAVPAAPAEPPGELPLRGLHVVEATSRMQGPLAGLLLQMLGAEVVRIEPPGGDVGRMVPPLADGTGSFFLCFNRGKRPLELDLSAPSGRAELSELVERSDVFLHNLRPGKADEWGLGHEELARRNPGLVYATASGWGDAAPPAQLIGTDFLVQAYAGVGEGVNPDGEPPFPSRVLLTDFMGALVTCEGVLHGLYHRERRGRGCRVGTSLLAGAMALQAHVLEDLANGRENGRRAGRPVWGRLDRPLPAADGVVAVTADDEGAFRYLCQACGVDPDGGHHDEVERQVAEAVAGEPADHWEQALASAGVPCAVACQDDLSRVVADPRLSELFDALAATSRAPGSPWRFGP